MASFFSLFDCENSLPEIVSNFIIKDIDLVKAVADTDVKHTSICFEFAESICKVKGLDLEETKIVLSSIIAHDCAYPKVKTVEQMDMPETRMQHMQAGAEKFVELAQRINSWHRIQIYSDKTIAEVCAIVRQHDNPQTFVIENFPFR